MALKSINPSNGILIKEFAEISDVELIEKIEAAQRAFLKWKNVSYSERRRILNNAAANLRENKNKYGETLTLEMGKPINQAIAEVEKCAWVCEHYAENAEKILAEEIIETDASESYVRFDPLGIVLAVMPWNFPFWQVIRFAAPALMAGNAAILKHASNVQLSAIAIEEIFVKSGLPENLFTTLVIGSNRVEQVINHRHVKAVTLTGSEYAGKSVAEQCGKNLKKTVMELGGSDPFIVFADADIDSAVSTAVTARIINNGQSCIAAKRFIVVKDIAEEFSAKFAKKLASVKIGDPMDKSTELGPIAREDLLHELQTQVDKSIKLGAVILTGGKILERDGFYFPPTLITNVRPGMPAYNEEIFGPVASLIVAEDENDAIRIANDSPFGLGASLWTSNIEKAKLLASQIDSGSVFINGMVKSDPRLPFGGVKLSGYGRELSHYGIKEFVNIKTVWIK